ncbi:MAG: helix-turn-helix domain-containing protein [Nannocystales bacterium]
MSEADEPLADLDIDVCNVRPAFEASLAAGVDATEIQARLGWTRAWLERDGATVSGTSTYEHMAWMSSRPNFAALVLDMVRRHTPASLGVVGLACKTAASLGEALMRHGRYQTLINRTARYDAMVDGNTVRLEETRFGPASSGAVRLSDYTVLVAVQLLRGFIGNDAPILALHSRRESISTAERKAWEEFAGAPILTGYAKAALVCPVELMIQPMASHDTELSAYFADLLQQSSPDPEALSWSARVRAALEHQLADGTPTADAIARGLGLGVRTLARRLAEEDETFGALLTAVRRERARRLLGDENVTQAEVAFLLGYRDQASFHRSFRRWFGTTPAAFRQSLSTSR